MGYNITQLTAGPGVVNKSKMVPVVGQYTQICYGMMTFIDGASQTVTVPFAGNEAYQIEAVFVQPQSSNPFPAVTAITANTFTVQGVGNDTVMWMAIGRFRV